MRLGEGWNSHRSMSSRCPGLRRARELGKRRLCLGMGASLEKRRFGARAQPLCVYFQATDHSHLEVLAQLEADISGQQIPLPRRRGAA